MGERERGREREREREKIEINGLLALRQMIPSQPTIPSFCLLPLGGGPT